jgi:hypothetical protein
VGAEQRLLDQVGQADLLPQSWVDLKLGQEAEVLRELLQRGDLGLLNYDRGATRV